jgi:hypothetical protein
MQLYFVVAVVDTKTPFPASSTRRRRVRQEFARKSAFLARITTNPLAHRARETSPAIRDHDFANPRLSTRRDVVSKRGRCQWCFVASIRQCIATRAMFVSARSRDDGAYAETSRVGFRHLCSTTSLSSKDGARESSRLRLEDSRHVDEESIYPFRSISGIRARYGLGVRTISDSDNESFSGVIELRKNRALGARPRRTGMAVPPVALPDKPAAARSASQEFALSFFPPTSFGSCVLPPNHGQGPGSATTFTAGASGSSVQTDTNPLFSVKQLDCSCSSNEHEATS